MTSAFRLGSMEKSWDQNYQRRHMVGVGTGRAVGINIGGLNYGENGFSTGATILVFLPHKPLILMETPPVSKLQN